MDLLVLPARALAPLHCRAGELGLGVAEVEATRRASLEVWSSNQQVVERARLLESALAAEGVAPVAIKGLALVGDHSALDRRLIGDIDMLLSVDELPVAIRVLAEHGHQVDFLPDALAIAQRHAVIAPAADGVWVDLHWRAGGGLPVWAARREPEAPWPTARSVPAPSAHPLYGSGWRVLQPHDSLAVLALHGCRVANHRAVHLMADAHVLMSRPGGVQAPKLLRALDEIGHLGRGTRWLQSVAEHFGTELPEGVDQHHWTPAENWATRLERIAASRTRSGDAGPAAMVVGLLAGSASVTVGRPWRFPAQVVGRVRWHRASRHHTRIEPPRDGRW